MKTNKKPSSANITSMYWGESFYYLTKIKSKKEIIDLMKFLHKEDIPFSSISSMQNWKGIPDLEVLWELIKEARKKELNLKKLSGKQLWVEATLKLVKTAYEQKRKLS